MAQKRRAKPGKATRAGDLEARANRAGKVKGGIIIDYKQTTGADKPGETHGVIAIIKPGGAR